MIKVALAKVFSVLSVVSLTTGMRANENPGVEPHIAYGAPTVLAGNTATFSGAVHQFDLGPGKVGWIQGWTGSTDMVIWTAVVDRGALYKISAVIDSTSGECAIKLIVDRRILNTPCAGRGWERVIAGDAYLTAGVHTIRAISAGRVPLAKLFSLEFVRPRVEKQLAADGDKQRASTRWMVEARYGLMFHWTRQTQPRDGLAKSYCDAVRDFDVHRFAGMVSQTGAGFVIFTTSHAGFYFPGPNPVIDRILPGRTCPRDLVRDMADALADHRVRLELYFHPGHDDAPWWHRTHFDEPDKSAYFQQWREIISQIGRQYGAKVAGFWFDDAAFTYYPFNPSWQELAEAARTGDRNRVLAFNSWILPKLSDFYDVYAGENADWDPQYEFHEYLPSGGTGRYTGGPQQDLQAEVLAIVNEDWGHFKSNQPIALPSKMSIDSLVAKMKDAIARKEVPVLDVEIYQDGTIGPETLRMLEGVRKGITDDSGHPFVAAGCGTRPPKR